MYSKRPDRPVLATQSLTRLSTSFAITGLLVFLRFFKNLYWDASPSHFALTNMGFSALVTESPMLSLSHLTIQVLSCLALYIQVPSSSFLSLWLASFFCLHIWKFFYKGDGCPIFFFNMVTRWLGVFWCLMWLFCKENGGNRKASFGITVISRILIYFLKREKVQSNSKI